MNSYFQRQFSSKLIPGSALLASAQSNSATLMDWSDTYPANILLLAEGKSRSGVVYIGASSSQVVPLPVNYTAAARLGVVVTTAATLKLVHVIPLLGTSTVLVRAMANSNGVYSIVSSTTSLTVFNESATTASYSYMVFEYPDITSQNSWRSGPQSTGIVTQT